MGETAEERLSKGFVTAAGLFAGSPNPPNFPTPDVIQPDWGNFTISTVMGDVWTRPGLVARDRSAITIALLTALRAPEQLRAYIGVGLNQGLSREEVCEIIFHTTIYAGFPAALEGFRIAGEVFDSYDAAARDAEVKDEDPK